MRRGLADRLEFRALLPRRIGCTGSEFGADRVQEFGVLGRTAQVPVGLHGVGYLVIVVIEIFPDLLFAGAGRPADHVHALVEIEDRHAVARELELVGPVEMTEFGIRLGADDSLLGRRVTRCQVFQCRLADADDRDIAGPAVDVRAVDVQVGERGRERVQRVPGIVAGAEQALLFSRRDQEHDAALGLRGRGREGAGDGKQRSHARSVVERAVIDLVVLRSGQGRWSRS